MPPSTKPRTLSELFGDDFTEYRQKLMGEVAQKAIDSQLETLRKAKEVKDNVDTD